MSGKKSVKSPRRRSKTRSLAKTKSLSKTKRIIDYFKPKKQSTSGTMESFDFHELDKETQPDGTIYYYNEEGQMTQGKAAPGMRVIAMPESKLQLEQFQEKVLPQLQLEKMLTETETMTPNKEQKMDDLLAQLHEKYPNVYDLPLWKEFVKKHVQDTTTEPDVKPIVENNEAYSELDNLLVELGEKVKVQERGNALDGMQSLLGKYLDDESTNGTDGSVDYNIDMLDRTSRQMTDFDSDKDSDIASDIRYYTDTDSDTDSDARSDKAQDKSLSNLLFDIYTDSESEADADADTELELSTKK